MAIECTERPSPNFDERKGPVDILLMHYTGMETAEAAAERLCSAEARVSAHYMICEDGQVIRMVPEELRAWHAGVSSWAGETDINSRSIGIEIVNGGHDFGCPPYPEAQMRVVEALSREIVERWNIPARRVIAHSDVAPARKADPGEWFDWARLARAGVGLWVEPEEIVEGPSLAKGERGDHVADLQFMLADYGYGVEVMGRYDETTEQVVTAFQRHFRQAKVDGVADISTIMTLRRLLELARG